MVVVFHFGGSYIGVDGTVSLLWLSYRIPCSGRLDTNAGYFGCASLLSCELIRWAWTLRAVKRTLAVFSEIAFLSLGEHSTAQQSFACTSGVAPSAISLAFPGFRRRALSPCFARTLNVSPRQESTRADQGSRQRLSVLGQRITSCFLNSLTAGCLSWTLFYVRRGSCFATSDRECLEANATTSARPRRKFLLRVVVSCVVVSIGVVRQAYCCVLPMTYPNGVRVTTQQPI